jgi:chloramphenicol-sensitive protein RarD
VGTLVLLSRKEALRAVLSVPRRRRAVILMSLLIGGNWFVFIYAVSIEQVVQASLGYYINPLFSILLGTVVLRERLGIVQFTAVILAAIGVTILTVRFGAVPWIALALTFTFGCYGLVKKRAGLDSLTGLALETTLLAPLALALIGFWSDGGGAFFTGTLETRILLVLSGAATALPLYWFAQGAKRVPLSQIGFTQYIGPSLMLLIGVLLFGEPFTTTHAVSFGIIWTALALYSLSHTPLLRRADRTEVRLSGFRAGTQRNRR